MVVVCWVFIWFTSLQRYFSHIATSKQQITNLYNCRWDRESYPESLAPQAKSFSIIPPLLPKTSMCLWSVLIYLLLYVTIGGHNFSFSLFSFSLFSFSLFRHCFGIILQLFVNCFIWLRITDEGLEPEMRIWSILLIKSDLKWCIHLS